MANCCEKRPNSDIPRRKVANFVTLRMLRLDTQGERKRAKIQTTIEYNISVHNTYQTTYLILKIVHK